MWDIFLRENDPQEKERLLIGLADVRDPTIILRSESSNWTITLALKINDNLSRKKTPSVHLKDVVSRFRYLERVSNENLVRRQNFFEAIGKVASNPTGLAIVWDFLRYLDQLLQFIDSKQFPAWKTFLIDFIFNFKQFRTNWDLLVRKYTLNDAAMGSLVGKIVSSFRNRRRLDEAKKFFDKYPDAGAGANSRRLALEESASNIEWIDKHPEIIDDWLKKNKLRRTTEIPWSYGPTRSIYFYALRYDIWIEYCRILLKIRYKLLTNCNKKWIFLTQLITLPHYMKIKLQRNLPKNIQEID